MKGNPDIIATLNKLLAEELTAISQYMVHSEMFDNWGYTRLHKLIEKTAIDEMKHAEKLIGRILFLEGTPIVSSLNPMHIGKDVRSMTDNDLAGETDAIASYNKAIVQANAANDAGTRELLEDILEDEEGHLDLHESNRDQMEQMGVQTFLVNQVRE